MRTSSFCASLSPSIRHGRAHLRRRDLDVLDDQGLAGLPGDGSLARVSARQQGTQAIGLDAIIEPETSTPKGKQCRACRATLSREASCRGWPDQIERAVYPA